MCLASMIRTPMKRTSAWKAGWLTGHAMVVVYERFVGSRTLKVRFEWIGKMTFEAEQR